MVGADVFFRPYRGSGCLPCRDPTACAVGYRLPPLPGLVSTASTGVNADRGGIFTRNPNVVSKPGRKVRRADPSNN